MHEQQRVPGTDAERRGFAVLRHRDFRLFWVGAVISFLGLWMEQIARNWLIYSLTGSALLVGLNGLFMTIPFVAMSLYAGTVVDRVDRRRMLIWVELLNLASFVLLALLIATGSVQIWHIYATSMFQSLVGAFENPARNSLLPFLVPRSELTAAIGLFSVVRRGTQIIGPALGGIAVAAVGVEGTYFLIAGIYAVLPISILMTRTTNAISANAERNPLKALRESFGYVRAQPVIGPILLLDTVFSIFGNFSPMMVVFARDIFAVGAEGLGLLQSAVGAGSVVGSFGLATIGDVQRKGRLMIVTGVVYGLALVAFAFCPWFLVALPILAVVGAADMLMGTFRVTMIQLVVRNDLRGRVSSLQSITTRGLSPLGGLQLGALASVTGVPVAVATGALVCITAILTLALRAPAVRNFTTAQPSTPEPERTLTPA